jgi:hypothetical protein
MSTFASPLDAALRYAERGWHVFPVKPDKKPHNEHGFLEATTDEARIVSWWRRWPNAQVGIAAQLSGICVVDLDVDSSKGKDGLANWTRLCDQNGQHGCGLIATTPRGGRHYVYACPEPAPVSRADIIKGSGIDVRCAGGYIVAPGPSSPGRVWEFGDPFDSRDVQPMPTWVSDLLDDRPAREPSAGHDSSKDVPLDPAQRRAIEQALPYIPNDERDVWIRVGMALKSTGAGEAAYELWERWSMACGIEGAVHPKFREKDQRYQWRSIREYFLNGQEVTIATLFHMAKQSGWRPSTDQEMLAVPIELPAEPVEPVDLQDGDPVAFDRSWLNIPGILGDMVQWMLACSVRQQPALCLGSAIATLGAVMGRRVATPTDLRTNFYCMGIGDTACGKDASIKLPAVLLAHAGLDRHIGPGEWRSDSGLRAAIAAEPSHVALIDEFTKSLQLMSGPQTPTFLKGIKRYLLQLFTSANGVLLAAAMADRKLNPPTPITEPHLCLYGTGVPRDLFGAIGRGAIEDGFLNRFLVFFVDDHQPPRHEPPRAIPPAGLVASIKALARSLAPSGVLAGAQGSVGVASGCRTIPVDPDALDRWRAAVREADDRIRAMREAKDQLADLWTRYGEHVYRLALVRAVGYDHAGPIRLADMTWAADIARWCLMRLQIEARGRMAESDYEEKLQAVLRVITEAGREGATTSQITMRCRSIPRMMRTDILRDLAEGGTIVSEERQVPAKGRTGGSKVTVHRAAKYRSAPKSESVEA